MKKTNERKVWNDEEFDAVARKMKTLAPMEMLKKIKSQMRTGKACRINGLSDILQAAQEVLPEARRKPNLEKQCELVARLKHRMLSVKVHGVNLTAAPKATSVKATSVKAPKTNIVGDQTLSTLKNISFELEGLGLNKISRAKILNSIVKAQ